MFRVTNTGINAVTHVDIDGLVTSDNIWIERRWSGLPTFANYSGSDPTNNVYRVVPFDLGHPHPNVFIPRVGGSNPLANWWFAGPPHNSFFIRQSGVYNIKAQIAYQRFSSSGSDLDWGDIRVGLRLRMSNGGVTTTI